MAIPTPEPVLVQSAYEDQVKLLYKELCVGLSAIGGVPSAGEEQQCLQRFKTGLGLARRAKELALTAFPPPVPTVAALAAEAPKPRRSRKAQSSAKARPRK
jgi:hypothetical protein